MSNWKRTTDKLIWITLALGWGGTTLPAIAAQRLTLRLGPFEQVVAVSDLEQFAKTGRLSPALQPYAVLLTPQVRQALNRRLQINSSTGEKLIERTLHSPTGKRLLSSLGAAFPDSTIPQLQLAALLAVRQAQGLSPVSFLRAYPTENVTVNASSAIALALQFNPAYWQSQALSPILERDLFVNSNIPFQPTFNPAQSGTQTVHQETLFLLDRSRHRTIPVDLYWSANTQGPLVVISHGFGANRKFLAYLAHHLASYGLTVAALEHPGSNASWLNSVSSGKNPGGLLSGKEFIDRPKDISFLLDELAKLNQQSGPLQCQSAISIGSSPSDLIECAAADLPNGKLQLKDRRVTQVIALNPLVGHLFGKNGLTQVTTPVLLLASTEDALTPIVNNQLRPFTQFNRSKYLLTAIGATHLSVADPTYFGDTMTESTLVKERRGAETQSLRNLVQGVSLAFIELTSQPQTYAPFLTSAYAQSLSTPQLPLRLNSKLPASITSWIDVVVEVSQLPRQLGHPQLFIPAPFLVLWQKKMVKRY